MPKKLKFGFMFYKKGFYICSLVVRQLRRKNSLLVFGMLFTLSMFAFLLNQVSPASAKPRSYFDQNRDYTLIPFDELDATYVCNQETKDRYGEKLVRLTLDDHSTRFDNRLEIYKVFMTADLGNLRDYEELAVHCFVDPIEYAINHYRAFSTKQESLWDKAVGVFGF